MTAYTVSQQIMIHNMRGDELECNDFAKTTLPLAKKVTRSISMLTILQRYTVC